MRNVDKKRITTAVLILFAIVLAAAGCVSKHSPRWGEVLKYEGGSLFYTSKVTKEDAQRLGDYLLKAGLFKAGKATIAQLTKQGQVYQLRVVSEKGILEKKRAPEEMGPVEAAGLLAEDISKEVFGGAKVEWHICDDNLNTLSIGSY